MAIVGIKGLTVAYAVGPTTEWSLAAESVATDSYHLV